VILDYYRKTVSLLVIGAGLLGALCIFIATMTTFYEVFARYILHKPTTWSLDYGIYLVMWGTMLGISYTLKWHGHVNVEVLVVKLSKNMQKYIKVTLYIIMLIFCIILSYTFILSCFDAYKYNEVTLSYTRTPLYIPLSAFAIGSTLMVLETMSQLSVMLQKKESQK